MTYALMRNFSHASNSLRFYMCSKALSSTWSDSSEEWIIRPDAFNGFKPGSASVVFAACFAILVPFGQNRILTSIAGNVSLFLSIARETALL